MGLGKFFKRCRKNELPRNPLAVRTETGTHSSGARKIVLADGSTLDRIISASAREGKAVVDKQPGLSRDLKRAVLSGSVQGAAHRRIIAAMGLTGKRAKSVNKCLFQRSLLFEAERKGSISSGDASTVLHNFIDQLELLENRLPEKSGSIQIDLNGMSIAEVKAKARKLWSHSIGEFEIETFADLARRAHGVPAAERDGAAVKNAALLKTVNEAVLQLELGTPERLKLLHDALSEAERIINT